MRIPSRKLVLAKSVLAYKKYQEDPSKENRLAYLAATEDVERYEQNAKKFFNIVIHLVFFTILGLFFINYRSRSIDSKSRLSF